jgi:hypothetical protein
MSEHDPRLDVFEEYIDNNVRDLEVPLPPEKLEKAILALESKAPETLPDQVLDAMLNNNFGEDDEVELYECLTNWWYLEIYEPASIDELINAIQHLINLVVVELRDYFYYNLQSQSVLQKTLSKSRRDITQWAKEWESREAEQVNIGEELSLELGMINEIKGIITMYWPSNLIEFDQAMNKLKDITANVPLNVTALKGELINVRKEMKKIFVMYPTPDAPEGIRIDETALIEVEELIKSLYKD